MKKKLKIKFILISMLSVFLVLFIIIGIINIVSYSNINKDADNTLELLISNNGSFNEIPNQKNPPNKRPNMSPEVPFETRYFTVTLNDTSVISIDTGKIAAISSDDAKDIARELYDNGDTSGFYKVYKYKATSYGSNTMYVFLDCSNSLNNFYSFLKSSLLISLIGLILVFILVFFLSNIVVKPFVDIHTKQQKFITNASHEIKTPLTVINSAVDIIEMEGVNNEWTKSIKNQIDKLTKLTNKLIYLSRLDEQEKIDMEEFNLTNKIKELIDSFIPHLLKTKITINQSLDENIMYKGNVQYIEYLLSILIDNAIKYCSSNHIDISLKGLEFTIKNEANSIKKGNYDYIFDRFYRLEESRNSKTGGNGIGLSIAKSIVSLHKGKITAKAENDNELIIKINF